MMKNCPRVNPWGFVVAALTVSIVSLSLPSAASAASQPVPFKAQFAAHDQISVDPVSCPVPPHYASTILGTGVGTHLGRFTVDLHDCFTPAGPGLFVFQNGVFTLTAADGSRLQGTYSGQLVATPTTNQDAIFALHGTYQITGGTKRFQNATGSGTMAGTENILTAELAVTLTGSINF
jgi:hypothetical protein